MPHFEVIIETHFCAAHALREYKGATEPTHGHNFQVYVTVTGKRVDKAGMLVDFLDIKPLIDAEMARMNHGFLNENVAEFKPGKLSPSAENIAFVLFTRLAKKMPKGARITCVKVGESPGCWAAYHA